MSVIFYQGRFPATLCKGADKTSFFRAGARVFAQLGPVSASLLAIDKSGSVVRDVLNESQFTYSAYGYAVGLANGHCRLGFNGELYDYCFQGYLLGGKRAFIPSRPGFNSPDELNFRGDELNVMSYCSGDPVNYSDPSGRVRTSIGPRLVLGNIAAKVVTGDPRVLRQLAPIATSDWLDSPDGRLRRGLNAWRRDPYFLDTKAMEPAVFKHYFKGAPNGEALAESLSDVTVNFIINDLGSYWPDGDQVKLVPASPEMGGQKIVLLGMLPQHAKKLMSALKPYQQRVIDHLSGVRRDPALSSDVRKSYRSKNSLPSDINAVNTYERLVKEVRGS